MVALSLTILCYVFAFVLVDKNLSFEYAVS